MDGRPTIQIAAAATAAGLSPALAQVQLESGPDAEQAGEARPATASEPLPPADSADAPPPMATWLPAALLAVGIMLLMTSLLRRSKSKAAQPAKAPDERLADLRGKASGRENLERVMVDCEELSQRLAAHLDNKAAMLEQLIAEADAKIVALQAAKASASVAQQPTDPRSGQPGIQPGSQRTERDHEPADELRTKIYELADKGSSPVEIAQATDQPTGQVELILALRNA